MKQFLVLLAIAAFVAGGTSCWKKAENANESVNSNTAVENPYAAMTDAGAALAEGKRLLDENETEMAIQALRQAVKLNPDLAEAYFNLGIAYSLLELQNKQSGEMTEPANAKEGRTKTPSEKAFEHAVEAYKKWVAANPKDDTAHFYLGRTYAKLGKDEDAEDAFRQAVKLKPDDTDYQTELGAILIKLAKYREAIDPLKKAVEMDESNVRAQDLLEDAEAGRQRLDYVPKSNSNGNSNANANANGAANSNSNTSMKLNSNSNTAAKPPESNKPKAEDPKDKKPKPPANKPH